MDGTKKIVPLTITKTNLNRGVELVQKGMISDFRFSVSKAKSIRIVAFKTRTKTSEFSSHFAAFWRFAWMGRVPNG